MILPFPDAAISLPLVALVAIAPFVIPAAIAGGSALAGLFGAKQASDASKDAAAIQARSAQEALALQREMYGLDRADALQQRAQLRSDMAPYRQVGGSAMMTLGGLMGLPMMAEAAPAQAAPMAAGPTLANPAPRAVDAFRKYRDETGGSIFKWLVQPGVLDKKYGTYTPEQEARFAERRAQDMARQQSASGYTRMRAPTGEEEDVPNDRVSLYRQHGAEVI